MIDIPNLAFLPDGSYDLSTPERKLAACEAALRGIAIIPQAYHSRGPEFCRDEMARHAVQLVRQLCDARVPTVSCYHFADSDGPTPGLMPDPCPNCGRWYVNDDNSVEQPRGRQ